MARKLGDQGRFLHGGGHLNRDMIEVQNSWKGLEKKKIIRFKDPEIGMRLAPDFNILSVKTNKIRKRYLLV